MASFSASVPSAASKSESHNVCALSAAFSSTLLVSLSSLGSAFAAASTATTVGSALAATAASTCVLSSVSVSLRIISNCVFSSADFSSEAPMALLIPGSCARFLITS